MVLTNWKTVAPRFVLDWKSGDCGTPRFSFIGHSGGAGAVSEAFVLEGEYTLFSTVGSSSCYDENQDLQTSMHGYLQNI